MTRMDIDYVTPVSKRAWRVRDVMTGTAALAAGLSACLLLALSGPMESAVARHFNGDYVLGSQCAFWMGTVLGGLLGLAAMFAGVSVIARRASNFGLATLGALAGLGAVVFAAAELTG